MYSLCCADKTQNILIEKKKILFLTSANLAANPRLTKEVRLAIQHGFHCTVLQFSLGNWSDAASLELEKTFPQVQFFRISALHKPFFPWFFSSLSQKIFEYLPNWLVSPYMLSIAVGKRSFLLLSRLRHLEHDFDWVIAHNPAAFYPAMVFSKKSGCRLGIDIEDYHPGETNKLDAQQQIKRLMGYVLPHANYISYASPLIMKAVNEDHVLSEINQFYIINSSHGDEFRFLPIRPEGPLRLVWFSQFIDKGRGLEAILETIDKFKEVELHLIGNLNNAFYNEFINDKPNVFCHQPVMQNVLHIMLSKFDVGLALEPGRDLNNQFAISNKIVAYAQAGLYIVASNTPAQSLFLNESSIEYKFTDLSCESISSILYSLVKDKSDLRDRRQKRHAQGRKYDWDLLSNQLINVWRK